MNKITLIAGAAFLSAVSSTSFATAIDASTLDLSELQTTLNSITQGGVSSINANTDETGAEEFQFQTTGVTASYVATVSYSASEFTWGFYDLTDSSKQVTLFDTTWANGSNAPGDATKIQIDFSGTTVSSYNFDGAISASNPLGYQLLDSAVFSGNTFGFFATTSNNTWFSQSGLNTANGDVNGDDIFDNDHFLTYAAEGDYVDLDGAGPMGHMSDAGHWYIATELTSMAGLQSSYSDFTDIIVQLESVQPVPAPATLALFGLGLLGLGAARRRS